MLSLSSRDELFRSGEDYWRGKIWANLNYLTISALQRCSEPLAQSALESLKSGFVSNVLRTLKRPSHRSKWMKGELSHVYSMI